jgi:hypothetical protein
MLPFEFGIAERIPAIPNSKFHGSESLTPQGLYNS